MSTKRIFAMVIRHLYIWPRSLERFMWSFGWPFLEIVIWGLTMQYLQKQFISSFSIVTFMLGAVIFWNIISRTQNEIAINFLDEAWNKNLLNIFATPLTPGEFLIAMVIINILKLSFTIVALTLASWFFYQFNVIASFGFYIPVLLLNLLLIGWSIGFLVTGLILRFGYSVQELAWAITVVIQPFSCVFYPLSALPGWAQQIARIFPSSYIFEEMRRILSSGQINWNNILISFLLNIIYLVFSLVFFRLMFEKARENGKLVKLN